MGPTYSFTAEIWLYHGQSAWHFISLPQAETQDIKRLSAGLHNGFGSLKVKVQIAHVVWETSIFPDNKTNSYLLPVKKEIRGTLGIADGDLVQVMLTVKL